MRYWIRETWVLALGLVVCGAAVVLPAFHAPAWVGSAVFIGAYLPLLLWVGRRNLIAYRRFSGPAKAAAELMAMKQANPDDPRLQSISPLAGAFAGNNLARYRFRLVQTGLGLAFMVTAVIAALIPAAIVVAIDGLMFVGYLVVSEWATGHMSQGDLDLEDRLERQ